MRTRDGQTRYGLVNIGRPAERERSASDYVMWVLEDARRRGLATDAELNRFQMDVMRLLAGRVKRYTGGASTSVAVDAAERILRSALYSIGYYLKSVGDPGACLEILRSEPLITLHQRGQAAIKEHVNRGQIWLNKLQEQSLRIDNLAYTATLDEGLPSFFKSYNPEFHAHETPGSIDYPLHSSRPDLSGIEYIGTYLQALALEDRFCRRYALDEIHSLLYGYDPNHRELLYNIFTLVVTNAVGRALAEKSPSRLRVEPEDLDRIQARYQGLGRPELYQVIHGVADRICDALLITDSLLREYVTAGAGPLSVRLHHALTRRQLETLFICVGAAPRRATLRFEDGRSMDDEAFRKVAEAIRECRDVADKISIVRRDVHSIEDLVDILAASCLFGEEFISLFRALDDIELALVQKRLPEHVIDAGFHFSESEREWHQQLQRYLNDFDPIRGARIRSLAEEIDLPEDQL